MKKLLSIILCLILCLLMSACNQSNSSGKAITTVTENGTTESTNSNEKNYSTEKEQENLPPITPIIDKNNILSIQVKANESDTMEYISAIHSSQIQQIVNYINGHRLKRSTVQSQKDPTFIYRIEYENREIVEILISEQKIMVRFLESNKSNIWYDILGNDLNAPTDFHNTLWEEYQHIFRVTDFTRIDVPLRDGKIYFPQIDIECVLITTTHIYSKHIYEKVAGINVLNDFLSSLEMGEPIEKYRQMSGAASYSINIYFKDKTYISIGHFCNYYFSFNGNVYEPNFNGTEFDNAIAKN